MEFIHNKNDITVYNDENQMIAEVTFPQIDKDSVDVQHTVVGEVLRGQGIAGKLMEELVKNMQTTNRKAELSCSYAVKWFETHPEHTDLVIGKK